MDNGSSWGLGIGSAAAGILVGIAGMLGTVKGAGRGAEAVEYGALSKRLSELEARADQMGETIYLKDRQLIAALEEATEMRAAAQAAQARVEALEERCERLENAFDELLKRTKMSASERERLRTLYQVGDGLVFSTKG